MKKMFSLHFKDEVDISPIEIMEKNVKDLEKLCKEANEKGLTVILYSPEKIETPKNVYELSVIIAEDMVLKYNEKNEIVRLIDECKQLA